MMDIHTMTGDQLDALVAEKVMGLHVEWRNGVPLWVGKDLPGTPYILEDGLFGHSIKRYSTDIAAAFDVAARVDLFKNCRHLHEHRGSVKQGNEGVLGDWEWVVEEVYQPVGKNHILARGATAPLAICRAALEVVFDAEANQGCDDGDQVVKSV